MLGGVVAGIDGQFRTRGDWPLTLRLGVGVMIGSMRDKRSGRFLDSKGGPFSFSTSQSPSADYLDIAPEIRLGRKLGDHLEVNLGVTAHVLAALVTPRWDAAQPVATGADGEGVFTADALTGGVVIVLVPGLGMKYEF